MATTLGRRLSSEFSPCDHQPARDQRLAPRQIVDRGVGEELRRLSTLSLLKYL